jgi:hypothetical protein
LHVGIAPSPRVLSFAVDKASTELGDARKQLRVHAKTPTSGEKTLSVQTIHWLICIALTAVGSIGLSYHEIAAYFGLVVDRHREVPFGTLVSLTELIGGVALAWHWWGPYAAVTAWPVGSLVAFILTLVMVNHVQGVWLSAQVILVLWSVRLMFQTAGGFILLQ